MPLRSQPASRNRRRAIKDRVIDNPCIDIALPKLPDIRKTFDDVLTAAETERLVEAS